MMTPQEVKSLYYAEYVSPHGLGLLGSKHSENANGILFLAYQLAKFFRAKILDAQDYLNAFKALDATKVYRDGVEVPGVYKRGALNNELEAHDNLVGRAGLSVLCETNDARLMCEHGNKSGWSFNSHNPDEQLIRTTLQGGTVCFIKMCAGFVPYPIEYLWMLGGMLVAAFKGTPSTVNLNHFQLEILDIVFEKKLSKTHWTFALYPFVKLIFKIQIKKRFGGIIGSYQKYFGASHPMCLMEEIWQK